MTLTTTQLYMLRRLQNGVGVQELRKWDQRPLAGLFKRQLFTIDRNLTASINNRGFDVLGETTQARFRKDFAQPLFGNRRPK